MTSKRNIIWLVSAAILLVTGCSSATYVPVAQQPTRRPEIGEIRTGSAQLISGEQGTLSVDWKLGTAPFRVVWTFNGGVEQTTVWDTVDTRSYTLPVVWHNPVSSGPVEFNCRVEISDVGNAYATKTINFTVQPD